MNIPPEILLIIPILIILAGLSWGEKRMRKSEINIAFNDVDDLHNQELRGEPVDELLAWYRVRKRITSRNRVSKSRRQALLSAVEVRITQCRARKQSHQTVGRHGNTLNLISTQQ